MAATTGPDGLRPPPKSNNCVRVRMVDTTSTMLLNTGDFMRPVMKGHGKMSITNVAFLIENLALGKRGMFDLGIRKDWWNYSPKRVQGLLNAIPGLKVEKDTTEVLQEGGINLESINDIIWSHSHFDHMGSPNLFPPSTNLCYGKGTGNFPAYPENAESNLLASDFEDRKCVEIECSALKIGPFGAFDFYGDGSLYLLDTPGHWPGHLSALARTTPDTFLFLAGDLCHFGGDFRPSEHIPLPDVVPRAALGGSREKYPFPCPSSLFADHHPRLHDEDTKAGRASIDTRTTPFYQLANREGAAYRDPATAAVTTREMREHFDSDPNVLVCLAHDTSLLDHLPTFNQQPERDLNGWKQDGMKEKLHWGWLGELPTYDENGEVVGLGRREDPIVEGLWKDGKVITSMDDLQYNKRSN